MKKKLLITLGWTVFYVGFSFYFYNEYMRY